ncbi:MAG: hypothetical protein HYS21_12290 [Deltaproteobacteria bacterium]|nr:hypothetical protein [Deltaproteobacteria bacterium]
MEFKTIFKRYSKAALISFATLSFAFGGFSGASAEYMRDDSRVSWPDFVNDEMQDFRQRAVVLNVDKTFTITPAVPLFRKGRQVADYRSAFQSKKIRSEGGKLVIPLSTIPIYLEENTGAENRPRQDNPFGIQGPGEYDPHLADLGVRLVRSAGDIRMAWGQIEPERGRIDWEHVNKIDRAISEFNRNGVTMMVTVYTQNPWDQLGDERARNFWAQWKRNPGEQEGKLKAKLPRDMDAYSNFLRRIVERYDGDGVDDAPGSPVIKYWQITNEADLDWKDSPANFARLQKASYKAIKDANPAAQVVISGVGMPRGFISFYEPMLEELDRLRDMSSDRFFDIFDFHWWVGGDGGYLNAPNKHFMGGIEGFKDYVELIRRTLIRHNFDSPLWITEMCTHIGKPKMGNVDFKFQTELDQAAELPKRFVYSFSLGVEKIFWSRISDQLSWGGNANSFFNTVGLINNPKRDGDASKKLSYYAYKMLIEKLEGSDFRRIERLNLGEDVFAYKFIKNGKAVYVMWLR